MKKITFDDLIAKTIDEVLEEYDHDGVVVEIECVDGVVTRNGGEIVYSTTYWDFLRTYSLLPRLSKFIYKNEQYTGKTHLLLLREFIKDIFEFYNYGEVDSPFVEPSRNLVTIEDLGMLAYRVTEKLNSLLVNITMPYTTTFSAIDIDQVLSHPVIKEANEQIAKIDRDGLTVTPHHISECYKKIEHELFTDPIFDTNAFVLSVRTGQANIGQIRQFLGPVGYRTDVESSIFPKPIITSYAKGINKPADKAKDSRSDSKSQYMNAKLLGQTEYRNRELQIVSLVLGSINMDDCGSTDYLTIMVPRYTEEDKRSCFDFVGMYYFDDDSQRLKRIRKQDAIGLGGKRLKFRNPVTCKHPNPRHLCRCCMGDTAVNISAGDSVGQHCVTTLTEPIEQSVISNKHLDASSTITPFIPEHKDNNFIRVNNDELSIYLADRLENRKVRLLIPCKQCPNIADIDRVDNVKELNISQTSSLKTIDFEITYKNGMVESETVTVSPRGRPSSISHALLKYMKNHGWKLGERNMIIIDLDEWDINKPLFTLPLQHRNKVVFFNDFISNVKRYGVAHKANLKKGLTFNESVVELLLGTYFLVCEEFHFNFALYGVVLKSYLVCESDPDAVFENLSLPRPGIDKPSLGNFNNVVGLRSLSSRCAWEEYVDMVKTPDLYIPYNKQFHPMDSIFSNAWGDDINE